MDGIKLNVYSGTFSSDTLTINAIDFLSRSWCLGACLPSTRKARSHQEVAVITETALVSRQADLLTPSHRCTSDQSRNQGIMMIYVRCPSVLSGSIGYTLDKCS